MSWYEPNRNRTQRWFPGGQPSSSVLHPNYSRSIQTSKKGYYTQGSSSVNGSSSTQVESTVSTFSKVASGTNTPGFRNKRRLSKLPVNAYYADIQEKNCAYGIISSMREYFPWQTNYQETSKTSGWIEAAFPTGSSTLALPRSDVILAARRSAASKLLEQVKNQKVNISQMIAERNQTISMLTAAFVKTREILEAVRRRDLPALGKAAGFGLPPPPPSATSTVWQHASWSRRSDKYNRRKKRAVAMAANLHLVKEYGIKPLASDIHGLAELLAAQSYAIVRSSAQAGSSQSYETFEHGYLNGVKTTWHTKFEVLVRTGCDFSSNGTIAPTLSASGLTNPAIIAWEMMPFSFIVDWVLPLGDYFNNFDATLGLTLRDGYETVKTITTQTIHSSERSKLGQTWIAWDVSASKKRTTVNRAKMQGFPNALLNFPNVKNPCSVEHLQNAFALLAQAGSKYR